MALPFALSSPSWSPTWWIPTLRFETSTPSSTPLQCLRPGLCRTRTSRALSNPCYRWLEAEKSRPNSKPPACYATSLCAMTYSNSCATVVAWLSSFKSYFPRQSVNKSVTMLFLHSPICQRPNLARYATSRLKLKSILMNIIIPQQSLSIFSNWDFIFHW